MLQAPPKPLTFEELLDYDDGTDNDYELVDGELVPMPEESLVNGNIARMLSLRFMDLVGELRSLPHVCEVAVEPLPKMPRNRKPDLTILREDQVEQVNALGKQAITDDMEPPMLVVEVVSPGAKGYQRDYVDKFLQYQRRGIPEYWIVDPQRSLVTVLVLGEEGGDRVWLPREYRGDDLVNSSQFPNLKVTARQILEGERP